MSTQTRESVQARVARGLSAARAELEQELDDVARGSGLPARSVRAVELGSTTNLQLEQVVALAKYYGLDVAAVLNGCPEDRRRLRTDPTDYAELDRRVRANLRSIRRSLGHGTKRLAELADVPQTWLVRIESGEIAMLDLVRLERAAGALEVPLALLLAPT